MPNGFEIFIFLAFIAIYLIKYSKQNTPSEENCDKDKKGTPTIETEIRKEIERLKAERQQKTSGQKPTPTLQAKSIGSSVPRSTFVTPCLLSKTEPVVIQSKIAISPSFPLKPLNAPVSSLHKELLSRKNLKHVFIGKIILDPPKSLATRIGAF